MNRFIGHKKPGTHGSRSRSRSLSLLRVLPAEVIPAAHPAVHPSDIRFPAWNPDGFKIGLCDVPEVGTPSSLLCLANSTAVVPTFDSMRARFLQLYKRKAHVHHYTEYMEESQFDAAFEVIERLREDYSSWDAGGRRAVAAEAAVGQSRMRRAPAPPLQHGSMSLGGGGRARGEVGV